MKLQSLLHELVTCLRAPTTVLSGSDGQIRPGGVQGVLSGDRRVLSSARLLVAGSEPEPLTAGTMGPGRAVFTAVARGLADRGPDPGVRVERHREATPDGMRERVVIRSFGTVIEGLRVRLEAAADFADVASIKAGECTARALPATVAGGTLTWTPEARGAIKLEGAGADADEGGLTWQVTVPAAGTVEVTWSLAAAMPGSVMASPRAAAPWSRPVLRAEEPALADAWAQSLDDLDALRLTTTEAPGHQFVAAGSPWFLTLFGRDSLWAARMLLPLGTDLASSTLAILAARQGRLLDTRTAEAPGKILHEVRREDLVLDDSHALPPVYYGTIDATLLWVHLLHDAWRWGLDGESVQALLPHLARAMRWLADYADPDGDGFVEYVDRDGRGLVNQGWKDSADAVRFRDGRLAEAPIALVEVQAYAHEAALDAAALFRAFDWPHADFWLDYAAGLRARFRAAFWVEDPAGGEPYPAMALDGAGRQVDALTSNIGHTLGSGLLSPQEESWVAGRLGGADMDSGFGLRTMSTTNPAYSPLSYHCGSVWPHDTAIVADRLARAGHPAQAASLVSGLLQAARSFEGRLPELFAGDTPAAFGRAVPYPAACRPQAWAAAAVVSAVRTITGVDPDVPGGTLSVRPLRPAPVGAIEVRGMRLGDASSRLDVAVGAIGDVHTVRSRPELHVESPPPLEPAPPP